MFPVYASLGMCHRSSHHAVHDDCEAAIAPRLLHPSDRCHDGATLLRHYLQHGEFHTRLPKLSDPLKALHVIAMTVIALAS
jgi:hypothetical protein